MKNCPFCNNLIQDTAKFCPKCGANVQSANLELKAPAESSPISGTDSARSIPPPPPSRSAPGSIYSQPATSGSYQKQKNDSIGYQSRPDHSKLKNDGGVGKALLKLITISFGIIFVFVIIAVLSDSDNSNNENRPQAEAPASSESNSDKPNSESDSYYNATQEKYMAIQAEESRRAAEEESRRAAEEESRRLAELELAKAKEAAAEAERALIEERRKAADELAAQELSRTRANVTCPYNKANPLLCESRGRKQVACDWDYAACGEPSIHKTLSKTSCTNKAKTDRQNNQIIVSDGCRAQIVPQDN